MNSEAWQENTLSQLKDLLQSYGMVQAAFVVGSLANKAVQVDYWSDIDLIIVVSDEAIGQFFPGTHWMEPILPVFATSQTQDPPRYTLRVCGQDLRRVDFIFLLASAFEDPENLNLQQFQKGHRVLFSRSSKIDRALSGERLTMPEKLDPEAQFLVMTNDFWFKAMLVVPKVARNDLLIAYHLALDLMRDCLVLRMMLRDRAEDTYHHRMGGVGNELVAQMGEGEGFTDTSAMGILTMIENSSRIYERLASEWSPNYTSKRDPLFDSTRKAREILFQQED